MATNVQSTRSTTHPDGHTVVETTPNSVVTANGIGGVAVYDQDGDRVADSTLRPSIHSDPVPAATGTSGSVISWIIGAIVLIVLAYFLLQILF